MVSDSILPALRATTAELNNSTPMGDIKSQGIKSTPKGDLKSNHLKKKYVVDLLKHSYKQVFF